MPRYHGIFSDYQGEGDTPILIIDAPSPGDAPTLVDPYDPSDPVHVEAAQYARRVILEHGVPAAAIADRLGPNAYLSEPL